jgi:very-short-patch-repair endonuclease
MRVVNEKDEEDAPSIDARIAELAAKQCNAVSRSQAIERGASKSGIKRRVRAGRWVTRHPGVYVIAGGPQFWRQDVWCALLAIGQSAVVTHESALRLHGITLLPLRPITLTIPHGAHARVRGATVHQIDDLPPHRVDAIGALPVTTAERTLVDLAAVRRPRELARVVDEVVAAKKATIAQISVCLREVARRGKRGVRKLGGVLDERSDGYVPPQSELERALFVALAAGGMPPPQRQFPLPGRPALRGLVDAAYPEAKVLIEADGRRWHSRISDMKRDRERDNEAQRAGWIPLRFMYEQIVDTPQEVVATVADVLTGRGMPVHPVSSHPAA